MTDTPEERAERSDPEEVLRRLRATLRGEPASAAGADSGTGARTIGRYDVEREIARGGMGVILRVRDHEIRRHLAMKVLRDAEGPRADDSSLESQRSARFLEEAQVTGQLDHPGIVPVHEVGLDGEGRLFFTMRLVKGRTLDEVFDLARRDEEGWTRTRVLGVILKVCEAMAFAHERGVIHRDLKPSNVMVGRFGETYVMDWGLAKILDAPDTKDVRPADSATQTILTSMRQDESGRDTEDSPLTTMDGDVIGTPAYMSPEQALGRVAEIGPHSDVYSVGALLHHLLAGSAPYLERGTKANAHEVLRRVLEEPPRPLHQLAPDVPAELEAICEKAMAREPGERYASMLAMAEDLRAFLEHRVVGAYATGAVAEFRKWVERNRGLAASLAAALLVAFLGLAGVAWVQARSREELARANDELSSTNEELAAARSAAESSADLARVNATEALWQSYAASVGAAVASLELGAADDATDRLAASPEEFRGWEWSFLSNRVDASLSSFEASAESFVSTVAYDPFGRYVAAGTGNFGDIGGADFAVRVWDVEQGTLVQDFTAPARSVTSLEFSPSGNELVSGCDDLRLRLWDVQSGEELAYRDGMGPYVTFHPDGLRIAHARATKVEVWDPLLDEIGFAVDVPSNVRCIAISPDGERIAAGSTDLQVRVWELDSERLLRTFDLSAQAGTGADIGRWEGVTDVEFGPQGELLVALEDGDVRLLDILTGLTKARLTGHRRATTAARFGPDGRRIVSSSTDGTIRIWEATGGEPLETLHGHSGLVTSIALGPDGHRIVSGSHDRTVRLWDGLPGSSVTTLAGVGPSNYLAYGVTFDHAGERIAWRPDPRTVRISDARTGEDLCTLPQFVDFVRVFGFHPDGKRLFTAADNDFIRVWDAATGELLATLGEPVRDIVKGDLAPDGEHLVRCHHDGTQSLLGAWNTETGEAVGSWNLGAVLVFRARFAPDGRRFAAAGFDGLVRVYALGEEEPVGGVRLSTRVHDLAWHPDGRTLAANTYDAWDDTLYIGDPATGEILRALRGHAQPGVIAYSPDGSRVLTGNWDGTLSLWDPERGEIASLRGHGAFVADVAFGPEGKRVASVEAGGRHLIWETMPARERATERRAAARRAALAGELRPRVDELLHELLLKEDVVQRLERDTELTSAEREAALRLTHSAPFFTIPPDDDPFSSPTARAFLICLERDRKPDDYLRALRMAELACRLLPVPVPTPAWSLLGLARLRMGRTDEALEMLREAAELGGGLLVERVTLNPLLIALCHLERGAPEEAEPIVRHWRRYARSLPKRGEARDEGLRMVLLQLLDEVEERLSASD